MVLAIDSTKNNIDTLTGHLDKKIEKYNKTSKLKYEISLSVGASHYSYQNPISVEKILNQADKHMYEQKKKKKKEE